MIRFVFCKLVLIFFLLHSNNAVGAKILIKSDIKLPNGQNEINIILQSNISNSASTVIKNYFLLTKPDRFVIDISSTEKISIDFKLPQDMQIRNSSQKNNHRIVIDIPSNYKIIKVKKNNINDISLVVKNENHLNPSTTNINPIAITMIKDKNQSIDNGVKNDLLVDTKSNNNIKNNQKVTIAIDAGHGGRDPGTIGSLGVPEKTITLMYARTLQEKLKKAGFTVVMTRDQDVFVPLEKRVEIARKCKADLFISIHADNAPSQNAQGMTIYTMENLNIKDDNWGGFYKKEYIPSDVLECKDKNVSDILIDISQKNTKSKTASLVDQMLEYLKHKKICIKCKHKSKSLAVLRGVDMQSFLIEVGYFSNFNDELKIISASYIESVTNEINNFLYNHFYNH